ncbi:MAG: SCO family protein [Deltaproteobacteria bacterium]|jgi:cytochrome c peroxidase|nr:SCO family protein [Deltaproteobacteria bacterium]
MSAPFALVDRRIAAHLVCAALIGPALAMAAPGKSPDGKPLYQLPEPGSYELPVIDRVGRYELLNDSGERVPLLDIAPGGCAVVSFVYASCPDAGGCPLVLALLRRMDRTLAAKSDLASRIRLVTVSFDPERDTPKRLAELRDHLKPIGEWHFRTAGSDREIRPVLDDFGQDALRLVSAEDGRSLGVIRHIAKVFLVDSDYAIRNIYSTGFLDQDILLRDIETLLLEERPGSEPR